MSKTKRRDSICQCSRPLVVVTACRVRRDERVLVENFVYAVQAIVTRQERESDWNSYGAIFISDIEGMFGRFRCTLDAHDMHIGEAYEICQDEPEAIAAAMERTRAEAEQYKHPK